MKVSDYIVSFLENNAVKNVFSLTGGGCMHLTDSFGRSQKMNITYTHHEQAAAMAAEACAKYSNKPSVVLVTSGPGATNTVTGVLGCWQDSTPCIFISGQSKLKQTVMNSGIPGLRQFGVQEANIIPIVSSITKYSVMISDKHMVRYHLERALYLATSGRPGPVWLDVPLDIQSANISESELKGFDPSAEEKKYKDKAGDEEISAMLALLKQAQRPVIVAGNGIKLSGACGVLLSFVEKHAIPVVTPVLGIDDLPGDSRCNIGRMGTKGTRAGNFCVQNSDLVLAIGSRMSVSVTGHEFEMFAREAKKVVVDIDPVEHTKNTIKIDKFINSDAKYFIEKLSDAAADSCVYGSWLDKCNEWKAKYPVCLQSYREETKGVNYYAFVDEMTKSMKDNAVVISDAGSSFYVVSQAVNLKKGQRYVTSGAIATMGFGLPAAIGAAVAAPGSQIMAVTGDGSFQQNIQELAVIREHKFPVKLFVMNNNGYFSIRQTQGRFFSGRTFGESPSSGIWFPSTEKIAQAYEMAYMKIENFSQLKEKMPGITGSNEPMIIEVMLSENFEVVPTVSSAVKSDGTMVSKPIEDMYPFLGRDEFNSNMIVKPVKE